MITMQVTFAGFRAELAPHFSAFAVRALWERYKDNSTILRVQDITEAWCEYLDMDDFNADNGRVIFVILENGGILCKL